MKVTYSSQPRQSSAATSRAGADSQDAPRPAGHLQARELPSAAFGVAWGFGLRDVRSSAVLLQLQMPDRAQHFISVGDFSFQGSAKDESPIIPGRSYPVRVRCGLEEVSPCHLPRSLEYILSEGLCLVVLDGGRERGLGRVGMFDFVGVRR